MALAKGKLHLGLKLDYCEPRKYEDWGIKEPKNGNWDYYSMLVYGGFLLFVVVILVS